MWLSKVLYSEHVQNEMTDVRFRVEGAIRDLHAAEVRYYVDSRARFMTTTHIKAAAAPTCTESNAYDVVISQVTEYDVIKGKKWNSVGKKGMLANLEVHNCEIVYESN